MKLTEQDFQSAANDLKCEPATVKAVTAVESNGKGFDDEGRIILRFEGHVFQKLTGGRFNKSNPNVSYPYSIQKSKKHGYEAFNEAFGLDPTAALESSSFGLFQPMGFNHKLSGFPTVGEFVDYLKQGEREQLFAFVNFVRSRGLVDELQNKQWAKFALQYNGAGYRANNYDVKLKKAYERFK